MRHLFYYKVRQNRPEVRLSCEYLINLLRRRFQNYYTILRVMNKTLFKTRVVLNFERKLLRVAVCKDRESAVSDPFGESLIFCPKLALGRLFSKIIFKSSNDFVYLGNLRKIKSVVKMRSKCGFLVD